MLTVLILGGAVAGLVRPVVGMGAPSSSCGPNLYDATISDFQIIYPGKTTAANIDIVKNPNATITIPEGSFYNVYVTVQTAPTSVNGNTQPGEVWYSMNAFTYQNNTCTGVSAPGIDTVDVGEGFQYCCIPFTGVQHVTWEFLQSGTSFAPGVVYSTVSYNVDWVPSNSTSTTTVTQTATTTSTSTATSVSTTTAPPVTQTATATSTVTSITTSTQSTTTTQTATSPVTVPAATVTTTLTAKANTTIATRTDTVTSTATPITAATATTSSSSTSPGSLLSGSNNITFLIAGLGAALVATTSLILVAYRKGYSSAAKVAAS